MYIRLNSIMRIVAFTFASLEAFLLAGQITTLVSTYWTSWDLKFKYTDTSATNNGRPHVNGQLLSQGHGGLWSRCTKVSTTDKNGEKPNIISDQCLNNYENQNASISYTYGKVCKTATAALCVGQVAVTLGILVIVLVSVYLARGRALMSIVSLPLLLLQGVVFFLIPLTYLSGNMSEMIDQLSATYGLLRIVGLDAGYAHDWAFWTQTGLFGLWIFSCGVYVLLSCRLNGLSHSDVRTNGTKSSETAEMQPLRNERLG